MSGGDDDDKPTVVLDLNALKKQRLKQEEELANLASELEFNVGADEAAAKKPAPKSQPAKVETKAPAPEISEFDTEDFAVDFLGNRDAEEKAKPKFTVILFDFKSDFFQKSKAHFPQGYNYVIAKTLPELNNFLKAKEFQIACFNYDVDPKAANQLSAQIKQKFPHTKVMIMAKAISPEKAKVHARTPSGASGYYQFPLDASKVEKEFLKIHSAKKVG